MPRIFISHHNSDKSIVKKITKDLIGYGHEIFQVENLTAGVNFSQEIEKQLSNSDITIVIITNNSQESKWLLMEAEAALGFVQERGKGAVIPVVFDNADIPLSLKNIQSMYASREDLHLVSEKINSVISSVFGRQVARDIKKEEKQEKIEKTAEDFIRESQKELKGRERRYRLYAHFWYGIACIALIGGVAASIWRALAIQSIAKEWLNIIELATIGILLLILIIAISKFAFTLGKAYMVESLRNADRSHAISFGEFYLKAFGDNLDWTEVKEAFQHWNIDKGSSFLDQNAKDFDPKVFETAIEMAKVISSGNKESKE